MYFAIATHIFVPNPENSAAFLHECLDFQTQYKEGIDTQVYAVSVC